MCFAKVKERAPPVVSRGAFDVLQAGLIACPVGHHPRGFVVDKDNPHRFSIELNRMKFVLGDWVFLILAGFRILFEVEVFVRVGENRCRLSRRFGTVLDAAGVLFDDAACGEVSLHRKPLCRCDYRIFGYIPAIEFSPPALAGVVCFPTVIHLDLLWFGGFGWGDGWILHDHYRSRVEKVPAFVSDKEDNNRSNDC